MSSVPPARSIRVGARASIRNFAHLFLVLFPAATRAVGAICFRGLNHNCAKDLLSPALENVSQNVKHDPDHASVSAANRGS